MYLRSSHRHSKKTHLLRVGAIIAGVALLLWCAQQFGVADFTRDVGSRALVLLARPAEIAAGWWHAATSAGDDAASTNAAATIDALRTRVAELEMIAASARETTRERDELRALLHLVPHAAPLVTARVIRHDLTTPYKVITIDRGAADGVRAGHAVASAAGLVGHVLRANATHAIVVLLTDPTHAVDVIDQRSRERGILLGNGDGLALGRQVGVTRLEYVTGTADILEGDLLITSGLEGRYPPGIPVGTVRAVRTRPDGFLESADVTPLIDWTAVHLVSVWGAAGTASVNE